MRYAARGEWAGQPVEVTWEDGRIDGPSDLVNDVRSRAARTRDIDLRRPEDLLVILQQVMDTVDVVVFDRNQPGIMFRTGGSSRERRT